MTEQRQEQHCRLRRLGLQHKKHGEGEYPATGLLIAGQGLEGHFKGGGERQVSLMSGACADAITPEHKGFCVRRFFANLILDGVDFERLEAGMTLRLGDCLLQLTQVGKECFDDCPVASVGDPCPLRRGCAFARIERGGEIAAGMEGTIS
ncbi:MAG: hypothetical protein IJC43_09965 [Clostridia bacterium]|nr:hypothetical protein [Clostridia bacterium]